MAGSDLKFDDNKVMPDHAPWEAATGIRVTWEGCPEMRLAFSYYALPCDNITRIQRFLKIEALSGFTAELPWHYTPIRHASGGENGYREWKPSHSKDTEGRRG